MKCCFCKSILILSVILLFTLGSCVDPVAPNPENVGYKIKEVKRYDNIFGTNTAPGFNNYYIDSSYMYAAIGQELQIFSVSDPLNIIKIASLQLPFAPTKLCFQTGILVVADTKQFQLIDISNPQSPVLGTEKRSLVKRENANQTLNLTVSDSKIYVIQSDEPNDSIRPVLKIYDIKSANSIESVSIANENLEGSVVPKTLISLKNQLYSLSYIKVVYNININWISYLMIYKYDQINCNDYNNIIIKNITQDSLGPGTDYSESALSARIFILDNKLLINRPYYRTYSFIYNIDSNNYLSEQKILLNIEYLYKNSIFSRNTNFLLQKLMHYQINDFQSFDLKETGFNYIEKDANIGLVNEKYIYSIGSNIRIFEYSK
jgi:hypothetical protein